VPDAFPRAYWNDVKIDRQICDYGGASFPNLMEIGARQSTFSTIDQIGPNDIDHVDNHEIEGYGGRRKKRKSKRY
jgi:hypothetical protein